jgi:hypothetical protein
VAVDLDLKRVERRQRFNNSRERTLSFLSGISGWNTNSIKVYITYIFISVPRRLFI